MVLSIFVFLYIVLTLAVGVGSQRYVHSSRDFMLANRSLPLFLCAPCMFSTWYGSETIMGASAEFLDGGFLAVIEDPFGTSLCFLAIGALVVRPIYRSNVGTIGDYFRLKFGASFELLSSLLMIASYLGWIAAQFLAMAMIIGTVFNISISTGIVLSSMIVCVYTVFGGMWSISINDFIQTIVIIFGLTILCIYLAVDIDDLSRVWKEAPENTFQFLPLPTWQGWCYYVSAWITIGLGSIPQQDVFQRIMSARTERVAIQSAFLSAFLYITIGLLPLFLVLGFKVQNQGLAEVANSDVLLQAVMGHKYVAVKIIFMGALLSAIMSSASGALLAPASILAENLCKPLFKIESDRFRLISLRISVVFLGLCSCIYAMGSKNVYALVAESSVISLVSLAAPLFAAIYWQGARPLGAILALALGPVAWLLAKHFGFHAECILFGFLVSIAAMISGSYLQNLAYFSSRDTPL